ncbi:hypothetical protein HA51_24055 [Pantoea rwandensis]|uniref:Uncharacterized protein n=1 Tax=Pantoea rwandensis TaxID=1076550 RepID=A0A1X1CNX7_9GAMM|nr:hypothetical protein HA51_24055 [Pantoea rwandensis]
MAALLLQRQSTISNLRHMGVPMTIRTLKPCAGRVTRAKPHANDSNDSHYQLAGRAGQKFRLQACRTAA